MRCHGRIAPATYEKYLNCTLEDILALDESFDTKVVNAVNEIPITVDEVKKVAIINTKLNDTAVGACMLQIDSNPDVNLVVLHSLTVDLTRFKLDGTFQRYQDEYIQLINGKNMIVVPLNEGNHYTLAVVRIDSKVIEYYNSFWQNIKGVSKRFQEVKCFLEKLTGIEFEIQVAVNLPTQQDHTSCGIYTILFAQYVIAGVDISNVNDQSIPAIRLNLANSLLRRPTLLLDHRPVKPDTNESLPEDIEVDKVEENIDGVVNNTGYLNVIPVMGALNMNKDIIRPEYPSYQMSLQMLNEITTPFRGYDNSGSLITYNSQGDWRKMLSVSEVICHLAPGNPRQGRKLLLEKLLSEPDVALKWMKNRKDPNQSLPTMFNFICGTGGSFRLIKKALITQGFQVINHRDLMVVGEEKQKRMK